MSKNTNAPEATATTADLLDHLIIRYSIKNDAKLAIELKVAPPVISKLRNGLLPLGASILARMVERFEDENFMELKEIAGAPSFLNR